MNTVATKRTKASPKNFTDLRAAFGKYLLEVENIVVRAKRRDRRPAEAGLLKMVGVWSKAFDRPRV